jgi:hypothetical protein
MELKEDDEEEEGEEKEEQEEEEEMEKREERRGGTRTVLESFTLQYPVTHAFSRDFQLLSIDNNLFYRLRHGMAML